MLATTHFFVKTCFPKSFIVLKLRALTEVAQEVSFRVGIVVNFFDNEERRRNKTGSAAISYKSPSVSKTATA